MKAKNQDRHIEALLDYGAAKGVSLKVVAGEIYYSYLYLNKVINGIDPLSKQMKRRIAVFLKSRGIDV